MLSERMLRAARLEPGLYEEVERDINANSQALLVVVIVAVASGIGAGLARGGSGFVSGLIGGILTSLLGWVVWSLVTYWVGTAIFHGTATPGELLRTIGFAQVPGVLNIFSFVPFIGGLIGFVVFIWLLVAGVIAVRQALDFETGKAVATVLVGWLAMLIVAAILAALGFGLYSVARL